MSLGASVPAGRKIRFNKTIRWVLLAVAAGVGVLVVLLAVNWPFTRQAITRQLEDASGTRVEIGGFRSTYFPYPGCVADNVVFRSAAPTAGSNAAEPIISMRRLTIESTFAGLLSKPGRIRRLIADGLRIRIP